MDYKLLAAIAVSELISLVMIWRLLRSDEHMALKVFRGLVVLIPVLGPVFYLFTAAPPERLPPHLMDKPNSTDYVDIGGRPNFSNRWHGMKADLEAKIALLKKEDNSRE